MICSKAKKLSQASDKQKRINELLNASHNSQAERDYLRGQILKIFEEDEKALENMAKDVPPRQRKPGRSQSIDGVNSRIDEGFDEESDFLNKSQRRSNDNGSNTTSGLGSDDLQSRGSLQFIDVKVSNLEIVLLIFAMTSQKLTKLYDGMTRHTIKISYFVHLHYIVIFENTTQI